MCIDINRNSTAASLAVPCTRMKRMRLTTRRTCHFLAEAYFTACFRQRGRMSDMLESLLEEPLRRRTPKGFSKKSMLDVSNRGAQVAAQGWLYRLAWMVLVKRGEAAINGNRARLRKARSRSARKKRSERPTEAFRGIAEAPTASSWQTERGGDTVTPALRRSQSSRRIRARAQRRMKRTKPLKRSAPHPRVWVATKAREVGPVTAMPVSPAAQCRSHLSLLLSTVMVAVKTTTRRTARSDCIDLKLPRTAAADAAALASGYLVHNHSMCPSHRHGPVAIWGTQSRPSSAVQRSSPPPVAGAPCSVTGVSSA